MTKRIDPEETLVKLFGSVSRARILSFLYAFEGQSFYQREIMYETGLALRAVQRELENLSSLGIVKIQKTHNRVYYEINRNSLFFKPFKEICGLTPRGGK
jgi:predicted transcriptional regulator